MKSESVNSYVEIKQRTDRDVRQLGVLASDRYEADSVAGQTVINLTFTVTQTTEAKRGFQLFIDGNLLREGSANDYQFTNIVNGLSSQVTLNISIAAGLNIIALKVGGYQDMFPNPSSVTATLNSDVAQPNLMAKAAFQPFVQKTFVTPSVTSIVNRAQVEAASLKAIMGVERIMTKSILLSRTEFGSNGEPVWEVDTKDSRIRYVGPGWISSNSTSSSNIQSVSGNNSDYIEIIFYGTGLNWLCQYSSTGATNTYSLDGGTAVTLSVSASASGVIASRNYATNVVTPVVAGLSLGWHTVKINNTSGLYSYGFEILNERSTVGVLAGIGYGGMKQEILSSFASSAYNTGITGARGGRVVRYLQNGAISQVVTNVNSASAFLTSTDHTNEEVTRKINYKEFGANRGDDLSTLTTNANAAFVLDDGTTTLVANQCTANAAYTGTSVGVTLNTSGSFFTLTFVGTGVDMIYNTGASVTADNGMVFFIDGTNQGFNNFPASKGDTTLKIASGLPYGTHTMKFYRTNSASQQISISDFIIYQPKKPVIPTGAIEICDYNVMANYVANTVQAAENLGTGVLRKNSLREFSYVGSFAVNTFLSTRLGGYDVASSTAGNYFTYTFFGTGFEYRFELPGATGGNYTISVDGSSNFSSYTTSFYGTGVTFTASTGVITTGIVGTPGCGISISGLPLGVHTVKVLYNSGSSFTAESLDVITPIHINNTKIGSLALTDRRCFSPIVDKPDVVDLSKAKAWLLYDALNSKIISSNNVSQVLQTATGQWYVYFIKPFKTKNYIVVGNACNTSRYLTGDLGPSAGFLQRQPNFASIIMQTDAGTYVSDSFWNITCFGELEDEGDI